MIFSFKINKISFIFKTKMEDICHDTKEISVPPLKVHSTKNLVLQKVPKDIIN